MAIASICEAKSQLSRLVDQAASCEEIIIAKIGSTIGPVDADPHRFLAS
jgi:antitoxin (DNA-binding transcriptional repressor) of toxin-antitoxin stability system